MPAEGRARVPYEGGGRRAGHHDNAGIRAAVQGASGLVKGMIVIIFAMAIALSSPSIVNYFSNNVEIESLTGS